jgi:hypothetical protein
MRPLQNILLLIGATALASAWGCIAIALLGALTVFRARSGEDWGTAFGMMYAGGCCGLPLGALAGFAAALHIAREATEDWSMIVWIGVALGVALGPASYSFKVAQAPFGVAQAPFDLMNVVVAALVTAMSGTVGGMLAATVEGLWRRASTGRSQFVSTVLGLLFAFVPVSLLLVVVTMLFSSHLTVLQFAWSILIGVPILCGTLTWLKGEEKQKRERRTLSQRRLK